MSIGNRLPLCRKRKLKEERFLRLVASLRHPLLSAHKKTSKRLQETAATTLVEIGSILKSRLLEKSFVLLCE